MSVLSTAGSALLILAESAGIVPTAAEAKRLKIRTHNKALLASKPVLLDDYRDAAQAVAANEQKVLRGETFKESSAPLLARREEAQRKLQSVNECRGILISSASDEVRLRYFRTKREVTSASTRCHLIQQRQIPDCQYELGKLREKLESRLATYEKFKGSKDPMTVLSVEKDLKQARLDVTRREMDLDDLHNELAQATEKLAQLTLDLESAERAALEE